MSGAIQTHGLVREFKGGIRAVDGVDLAVHTGQIVYATKLLTEGSLDELWMKTMR